MGPLVIEPLQERIEAALLLQEVLGRGLGGLLLQRPMHPLVTAVLLRMGGHDALEPDTQP